MVAKCDNCGAKIIKFPLWKIEEGKKVFLWKNLFKMSMDSIILLIVLVALITAYKIDTAKCNDMIENPLGYCEETNACKVLMEREIMQNIEENRVPVLDWGIEYS